MSYKQKARSVHDRMKEIAVKEGHKELLKLCRELDGIIQTLDSDDPPPPPPDDDGNHPKKPGNP